MNGNRHPVDRRWFLKSTAYSAAALATQTSGLGAPQAPAPPEKGQRKLVVVGAGIAGLSAALTAREVGAFGSRAGARP
jgi:threonine dehydrogenase-like Zn-dependent dehydrogenase